MRRTFRALVRPCPGLLSYSASSAYIRATICQHARVKRTAITGPVVITVASSVFFSVIAVVALIIRIVVFLTRGSIV